ncbi:hypothetical protein [Streptomyces jumonjinensis]|uniref:hypothetical protein n=1 Tax=Streptomyces jumonjinensis TaxID=1945 RepID=UPI0037A0F7BA
MNRNYKMATVAAGIVAIAGLGIGPAFAEGDFTTEIKGWLPGKESRHWNDLNTDNASTTVKFSGCKAEDSGGTNRFEYAALQLKKERQSFPDPVVDRDNNHCNTSTFGDLSSGWYYFNYSGLNGTDTTSYHLSVNTVVVKY